MGFCRYPGSPESFKYLFDASDADLISECVVGHCSSWSYYTAWPCLYTPSSGRANVQ